MNNMNTFNNICRLCLSVCSQKQFKITHENEVHTKLCQCLQSIITLNDSLPNHICTPCMNKLEEIDIFYKKAKANQKYLLQVLKTSNDCKNIKYEFEIPTKNKTNLSEEKEKSCQVKNTNIQPITNFNNMESKIKSEINDIQEINYSSEDDIPISNMKSSKKLKSKTKAMSSKIQPKSFLLSNDKNHQCLTCLEQLNSQSELVGHYYKQHGKKSTKSELKQFSTEILEGKISYKCPCGKMYDNKRSINRHMILTHSGDRPFLCKLCGRTYKTVSEIIRHSRAHNGVKIECSYNCGYSTVYSGALKEHEKRHRVEYKYKCSKCGKGFQVKTWFEEHQNIHSGAKPFVCSLCGLAFHMNRYLTAHKSSVHPQSSAIKRYICIHCSLPCDTRNTLTEHLKVHGIKNTFLCDICGKTLASGEQLKFHKRMHSGVKPYTCSICPKSFSKKYNLTVHMRSRSHAMTSQVIPSYMVPHLEDCTN